VISDNSSRKDEDFGEQYRSLSDEAITQLASEGGLQPEADVALRAEMRKRSIGTTQVRALQVKQKKAKLQMVQMVANAAVGRARRFVGIWNCEERTTAKAKCGGFFPFGKLRVRMTT
jgi:hypothetical protein